MGLDLSERTKTMGSAAVAVAALCWSLERTTSAVKEQTVAILEQTQWMQDDRDRRAEDLKQRRGDLDDEREKERKLLKAIADRIGMGAELGPEIDLLR